MTITLIIARHGNTFEPHETPTRIGKRTDLKLAKKGYVQGVELGKTLFKKGFKPHIVYASTLIRTRETAHAACVAMGIKADIHCLDIFDEIDYGPDENKPEAAVIARIGEQAIKKWNAQAAVPPGWRVDPEGLIRSWQDFTVDLIRQAAGQDLIVLVVTSNGVARFAPHITGDFEGFKTKYPLKLRTGAYGVFKYDADKWTAARWDERP
jgi:2,3-bisphosphoglycerate-dependent phosphoglycerate mutase